ncbi:MAG: benzoate/H(+) symporter BenE family transporter [Micrococcales bacterium]|nr:benzoate/H(+) symporter BenE family transporter [Micrococcales bacterium]
MTTAHHAADDAPHDLPAPVGTGHTVIAGVVCGLVGFLSAFPVVLTGLQHVGATREQAASGLMVLCLTMGLGCILWSLRLRMPITMAWSTPGAALLASTAAPADGFGVAVMAFIISGVLLTLTAFARPLFRAVEAIPTALANAMLAGVLLTLCTVPFRSLAHSPAAVAPVVLVWLLLLGLARRWAVPGALVAAGVVVAAQGGLGRVSTALPPLELVTPRWDTAAVVAIALPLFLVTMTSQNIPGMAVLRGFGYEPSFRGPLTYAGAASVAGAPAGGHAINLAAISAALAAGPEAGPDPRRRWIAGVSCGVTYLAFGPLSGTVASLAAAAPDGLIESVAGLALIATFAAAAVSALGDAEHREAAAITFLVAASGLHLAGIGAAFWGLLAGGVFLLVMRRRRGRHASAR